METQESHRTLPAGSGAGAGLEQQLRQVLGPGRASRAGLLAGAAAVAGTLGLGWAAGAWALRSPLAAFGASILVLSIAGLHAVWFRLALGRSFQDFHLSSRPFLDAALLALRRRQRFMHIWMPAGLFGVMLGINLIYLDVLGSAALGLRIAVHLGTNVLLAGAGSLAFLLRMRGIEARTGLLIQALERIRRQLDA